MLSLMCIVRHLGRDGEEAAVHVRLELRKRAKDLN